MKKKSPLILAFFICFLSIFSCSDEQDFDQARVLEVIPDISGSVIYLETTETAINAISPAPISQNINFDGFASGFFSDRVISGFLKFQFDNTTSKNIQIRIAFLDAANNPLDSVTIQVPAGPPLRRVDREFFYGPPSGSSIDIIRNTSSLQLTFINNSNNTSVSSLPDPKLIFKSSASFKLRILE